MKRKHVAATIVAMLSCILMLCGCETDMPTKPDIDKGEGSYTYRESLKDIPVNWNPHNYRNIKENYPADKLTMGFYALVFNDALHPVEGLAEYEGYALVPEMAADMPVDITREIKATHPEFAIPESEDSGYAYRIPLNKDARWEDGKAITADTYVESMKRLLSPELDNLRAPEYYEDEFSIAGAKEFARQGKENLVTIGMMMAENDYNTVEDYLAEHGDEPGYINWAFSFGMEYDWKNNPIEDKENITINPQGFLQDNPKDEPAATPLTIKQLAKFYVDANEIVNGVDREAASTWLVDELYIAKSYPAGVKYETVGCYAEDDYNLVIVLDRKLEGFRLMYRLTSTWLVEPELYDSCIVEKDGKYISNYNTSTDTTLSYGPYKLTRYWNKHLMKFTKNPMWYGWTDGKHVYVAPKDGNTYQMYQTSDIDVQQNQDHRNEIDKFNKGELSSLELNQQDVGNYQGSPNIVAEPEETSFFLFMNGNLDALNAREDEAGFDKSTTDLQTMALKSFKKALSLSFDKRKITDEVTPMREPSYGLLSVACISNTTTGQHYRRTDEAMQTLVDYYGVDDSSYNSLRDAADSITGLDRKRAAALYTEAYNEALELGYITDLDKDGISDQTVTIEYCLSADSSFMTKTIAGLNASIASASRGTPFEGRITIIKSDPYGNDWNSMIRQGLSDTVIGGWSGNLDNPFSVAELYTKPGYAYNAEWFDTTKAMLTLTLPMDGHDKELTMSLYDWAECLNGGTKIIDGVEYNFGESIADNRTRVRILAAIEREILMTYDYIPMFINAKKHLQSDQIHNVTDKYNGLLGFGGLRYLRYTLSDAEWEEYVKAHGGSLDY